MSCRYSSLAVVAAFGAAIGGGAAAQNMSQHAPAIPTPLLWSASQQGGEAELAQSVSQILNLLNIDAIITIMGEEGREYAVLMDQELFAGQGLAEWQRVVAMIYDEASMRQRFELAFEKAMAQQEGTARQSIAFFAGDIGRRAVALEVAARRSLRDPAVEFAAQEQLMALQTQDSERYDQLQRFARANELVDSNVSGALNANFAFLRGLAVASGAQNALSEQDMLADVWQQEPDIRAETEAWLYPYLALAYAPLEDAGLAAYVEFSESEAGQGLNHALFAAYDAVFTQISYDLGRAAGRQMLMQDI